MSGVLGSSDRPREFTQSTAWVSPGWIVIPAFGEIVEAQEPPLQTYPMWMRSKGPGFSLFVNFGFLEGGREG